VEPSCSAERRCRRRECKRCAPVRARDELRKFEDNLRAYGGRSNTFSITAPGQDVLPWGGGCKVVGPHTCSGKLGCRVDEDAAHWWNETASERFQAMWKAASLAADRYVRLCGWRGQLPRRLASVWSPQERGVWHVHVQMPGETEIERAWTRLVIEYVHRYGRAKYRWGYVDRNPLGALGGSQVGHERAARYLARNAAVYLGENASAVAGGMVGRTVRAYVSVRLTRETGVTMGNLRRVRYLYVVVTHSLPLPGWPVLELEVVWRLLVAGQADGRAPPAIAGAAAA
jgi:hypothetical protein